MFINKVLKTKKQTRNFVSYSNNKVVVSGLIKEICDRVVIPQKHKNFNYKNFNINLHPSTDQKLIFDELKATTLFELRDILHLLIPVTTQRPKDLLNITRTDGSVLKGLEMTIKMIDKDIHYTFGNHSGYYYTKHVESLDNHHYSV